jgi:hypothetical protein
MGFTDQAANIAALQRELGNLTKAIDLLINQTEDLHEPIAIERDTNEEPVAVSAKKISKKGRQ